jgi:formate-dependent nitrite reductase membrane component NrfD
MAACPYDALYIDPGAGTAAKCNYCAHRIERGMEPPCVTVCPEQAIVAGDMHDPGTLISELLLTQPVTVRKPEKETKPRVFYIEGDSTVLVPGTAAKSVSYAWAERSAKEVSRDLPLLDPVTEASVTYDVPHGVPWGGRVSLYIWTKSLAAGPPMVAALLGILRYAHAPNLFGVLAPSLALVMTMVTAILLIADLRRPMRFMKIIFHPNWNSWLVWGAYLLIGFSGLSLLWLTAGLVELEGVILFLRWPALLAEILAAGYTAFLLAQARARDLWQSRLLFWHLVAQAFLAGTAALAVAALMLDSGTMLTWFLVRCLLGSLCAHGLMILGEIAIPRRSSAARAAVGYMTGGPLASLFWYAAVMAGVMIPICLLSFCVGGNVSGWVLPVAAASLSLLGLLAYNHCYICAGQALPLS